MNIANTAPPALALLGLLLGMRHATDADHVVAVTAIVAGERRLLSASRIGLVWGLGHALAVLVVGSAIIIFRLSVPPQFALWTELAVALALIMVGALAMLDAGGGASRPAIFVHSHRHSHHAVMHRHPHVHAGADQRAHERAPEADHDHVVAIGARARMPMLRSFAVGLVHGLEGSAAIALVVLGAIRQPSMGVLYLLSFVAGTSAGMVLITTAIGIPVIVAAERVERLHARVGFCSGALSLAFGALIAARIAFSSLAG